jgi:hypothetical protein
MRLPRFKFLRAFSRRKSSEQAEVKEDSPYHAVAISCGMFTCEAARAQRGVRFLAKQAPNLPLAACDESDCTCKYVHYSDRRAASRRDAEMGLPGFDHATERRDSPGRRKTDGASVSQEGAGSYFDYASTTQLKIRSADIEPDLEAPEGVSSRPAKA